MTDDPTQPPAPVDDLGIPGLTEPCVIGRGGFGVVHRARQSDLNRVVAVKVLSADLDRAGQERFAREGWAMGTLAGHPHVVAVHSVGTTAAGRPYLLMPLLEGGSLAELLPVPTRTAVSYVVKLAGALHTAHLAGVLHRDLKPSNVLLSGYGEPQLADFGIARVTGGFETSEGVVSASIAYAAPEIFDGKAPTVASDVYSLAATLFAAVRGTPPFGTGVGEELIATCLRIARDPVPDLRLDGVPPAVCSVIEAGLAKDPAARPVSAEAFGRALQDAEVVCGWTRTTMVLAAGPSTAVSTADPPTTPTPGPTPTIAPSAAVPAVVAATEPGAGPRSGRRPLLVGSVGGVAAIVVAVAVLSQLGSGQNPDDGAAASKQMTTSSPAGAGPRTAPTTPFSPSDSASGPASAGFTAAVPFTQPLRIAIAPDGTVYAADKGGHRFQRLGADAEVIGGTGRVGRVADGSPATSSPMSSASGIAIASDGSIYVGGDGYLRRIDPGGIVRAVPGYDGPEQRYYGVVDLTIGREGLWVAEPKGVRLVRTDGTVVTVPGGYGSIAGLAAHPEGGVVVADGNRVYRVRADGTHEVIAGTGDPSSAPDDGRPAVQTRLATPTGLAFDGRGRLHIAELDGARIRRLESDGTLTTVAGRGDQGDSGDGGPARDATFSLLVDLAFDGAGRLYVVDEGSHRVRRIAPDGQRIIQAYS